MPDTELEFKITKQQQNNKWYKVLQEMLLGEISEFWIKFNSKEHQDFLEFLIEIMPQFTSPWKDLDVKKKQKKDIANSIANSYIMQYLKVVNLSVTIHKIKSDDHFCLQHSNSS